MKFPAWWTKAQSLPSVKVAPDWYLAWGRPDQLASGFTWQDDHIAIAHAQPALSPKERFVVVGDIWLSNRAELLQRMEVGAYKYIPTATQMVAHLWELKGVESLMLLEGMFALCVWDRQSQVLWLGRDRTGSRTLYYTTTGSTRWIAPRLSTLAPHRSNELDLVALRDYLCCAFVPGETAVSVQARDTNLRCFNDRQQQLQLGSKPDYLFHLSPIQRHPPEGFPTQNQAILLYPDPAVR